MAPAGCPVIEIRRQIGVALQPDAVLIAPGQRRHSVGIALSRRTAVLLRRLLFIPIDAPAVLQVQPQQELSTGKALSR